MSLVFNSRGSFTDPYILSKFEGPKIQYSFALDLPIKENENQSCLLS